MTNLKSLIEKNPNTEFVVMTHDKSEYEAFRDIVLDMGFDFVIKTCDDNKEAMDSIAKEYSYIGGWRVSRTRGIAFNHSQAHWEQYYADILEVREDGKLHFTDEQSLS